jgi:hypothetical protein
VLPFGGSAVVGPSWRQAGVPCGVAEEARTRGFVAGCAFCRGMPELAASTETVKHREYGPPTRSLGERGPLGKRGADVLLAAPQADDNYLSRRGESLYQAPLG